MGLIVKIGTRTSDGSDIEPVSREDAPLFPGLRHQRNSLDASASTWEFFYQATGVGEFRRAHEEPVALTRELLEHVQAARAAFQQKYPDAVASYEETADPFDWYLGMLIQLEWWMKWTLRTYDHPAYYVA